MTHTTSTTTTASSEPTGPDWLATTLTDQLEHVDSGPQRQPFVHGGSHAGVTARWVVMPPGHTALMHEHPDSVIVVSVVRGHAASIMFSPTHGLVAEPHGPGDVIIINRHVLHLAVNLSDTEPVVVSEIGTSDDFHNDVRRHEGWDDVAALFGEVLRARFAAADDDRRTAADVLIERLLPEYASTR